MALVVAATSACDIGVACTAEARFGLNVNVTDAASGARICDATVTAVDGDFSETLEPFGDANDCQYVGATERAGTYTITIEKDGFATATSENVVVDADECHVLGEIVDVELAEEG